MKKYKRKEKRLGESDNPSYAFNQSHEKKHSKRWFKRHKKWDLERYYDINDE